MFMLSERVRDAEAAGRPEPPKTGTVDTSLRARVGGRVAGGGSRRVGLTGWIGSGRVTQVAPESTPKGWDAVCVRFLRTQQRAESQCRNLFYPVHGLLDWSGFCILLGLWGLGWFCCLCVDSFVIVIQVSLIVSVSLDRFLLFVHCVSAFWVGVWFTYLFSMESLILAQDERWRRA